MSRLYYILQKSGQRTKQRNLSEKIVVDFAIRYGNPSINSKLNKLKDEGCENMVFTIISSVCSSNYRYSVDEVYRSLMRMRWQPSLKLFLIMKVISVH